MTFSCSRRPSSLQGLPLALSETQLPLSLVVPPPPCPRHLGGVRLTLQWVSEIQKGAGGVC